MMDNPITRTEYEKRHDELAAGFRAQVARLDSRIDKAEVYQKAITRNEEHNG